MINAILTALNEGAPNMLLTLLLISLLVIWLQSKLNKEFGSLRKEISDGNAALREDLAKIDKDLRKEIAEGNKDLRKEIAEGNKDLREEIGGLRREIGDVSKRLARVEGKLDSPACAAKAQPSAKTG